MTDIEQQYREDVADLEAQVRYSELAILEGRDTEVNIKLLRVNRDLLERARAALEALKVANDQL